MLVGAAAQTPKIIIAGLTVNAAGMERTYTVKGILTEHVRKSVLTLRRSWQSMDSNTEKINHSSEENNFQVLVHGVSLYETDDELVAGAVAHCYRSNPNWKDVRIK